MKIRKHALTTILPLILLGPIAVGCAAEEPEGKPYVPQITHSPQDPADDENSDEGEGVEPEISEDLENGGSELEPPEIPDEIYENTLEGAEAAARYYFRALEYGLWSHDAEPLKFICHEQSTTCQINIEAVNVFERKRRQVIGGEIRDGEVIENIDTKDELLLVIAVTQEPAQILEEDGTKVGDQKRYSGVNEFLVAYDGDRWQLTAISGKAIDE